MQNVKLKINRENKFHGFTLIEMIVALVIFIIVITVTVGIFSSILKAQRKTYNLQVTQDTARYLMEMMAKEIRMSTIEDVFVPPIGGGSRLKITRSDNNETIFYTFNNSSFAQGLTRGLQRSGLDDVGKKDWRRLNDADKVEVYGQFFKDSGNRRVTIVMETRTVNVKPGEGAVIKLQASLSSRDYGS